MEAQPETRERVVTQREKMRESVRKYGVDIAGIVQDYAIAERNGGVPRRSNINNEAPDHYAKRLYNDGRSGWGWG